MKMITHNAEHARKLTSENIDNDAKERFKKDTQEKELQFNTINDGIESAINGGRFCAPFPCIFRHDVIADVKLAGYTVELTEAEEDGWPGTLISWK